MSNCCDRSPSVTTNHCIKQAEPIRNPTTDISLPTIERAIDCTNVLVPCEFSHSALVAAQFCLDCLPSPTLEPTESEQKQFTQCLRSKGLVWCGGVIQVPELWVQALEESIDRNGENFSQIYISKLRTHAPAA